MATINDEVKVKITAEDNASKEIKKVEGSVSELKKGVTLLAAAFTATKIIQFANECILAYQESERVNKSLERSLATLPELGGGYENTADGIKKATQELSAYADTMARLSIFTDESIVSAEAVFAQYGAQTDQIKQLTPALLEYASSVYLTTGNQIELSDAATMLGKSFDGSSGILERFKIKLDETQLQLWENSTELERMGIVAEAMAAQYGGAMDQVATGTEFAVAQSNLAWDSMKEKVGATLAPIKQKIAETITWLIENFQLGWSMIREGMDNAFAQIYQTFIDLGDWLGKTWTDIWTGVKNTFDKVVDGIKSALDAIIKAAKSALDTLIEIATFSIADTGTYNSKKSTGSGGKGMASGGVAQAGKSYMVGERGVELFKPFTDGMVIPNKGLASGGTNITFVFNGTVSSKEVAEEYGDYIVDKLKSITKVV